MQMMRFRAAFSLLELSVAILIIGILLASVATTNKLLVQAELKNIYSELTKFESASQTFRTIHGEWPGDHPGAEAFYGASETNNGDGDGFVKGSGTDEEFLFWQHMALEGLIEGSFTGAGATGDQAVVGTNVPGAEARKDLGFGIRYGIIGGAGHFKPWDSIYRTFLVGGAFRSGLDMTNSGLTGREMYLLDNKFDDGLSTSGKINGVSGADGGAGTNCEDGTSTYNAANTDKVCVIVYYLDD